MVGDKVVAASAVGVRKYGTNIEVSQDDPFQLGSITKVMTATLIGMMIRPLRGDERRRWPEAGGRRPGRRFPAEVQQLIRQEIQNGTIRVCPNREGRICIMPTDTAEGEESIDVEVPPAPSQDEASPFGRSPVSDRITRR